ncbi:nitrate reductase cytochrome c-type subunit [Paraglaciecola aquimarina]|uniref:Periplasmic nitrate reductase, electron transfer subunit n=1 Tax=Paraglaciecola algarum TaxID=3050085 RepID=A0ABS9D4Y0_9ALTE|nr:nitrate reductase cytochrome c-type subunit [Paraglaciecola sp. G1-23]MCF2947988.1 nitrate reductase cytochrome c-type subunit [Paraglaciecola sp. G1-23]
MNKFITLLTIFGVLTASALFAQDIATLRNGVEISKQEKSQPIPNPIKDDIKVGRNYPMQPPIIPHNIRDYQVDLNVNKCLSCHSRNRISESQATMVSVTHYMDRDGNFLAEVSPRRYFCTQCHVTQHDTKPLVENDFIDMQKLIAIRAEKAK